MTFKAMLPEDFWSRVDRSGGVGACWPIQPPHRRGYGHLVMGGVYGAHRVAWTLANGPIPRGLQVRHSCDNPPCCNPAHLLVGTLQDNERDKRVRGRTRLQGRSGEANSRARLTADQVQAIRSVYALGGVSQEKLAKSYGISKRHVWRIVWNLRWQTLP